MQINGEIVNFLLIAAIVIALIQVIFNSIRVEAPVAEPPTMKEPSVKNISTFDNSGPPGFDETDLIGYNLEDLTPALTGTESGMEYAPAKVKLLEKDTQKEQYINKFLTGQQTQCPLPAQSRREFHNDFFSFRDKTYENSSMQYDTVDMVQDLYLSGNNSIARQHPNMRIKDVFDNMTQAPNAYVRDCVRLPKFDNVNPQGYYNSFGTPGLSLTRDNWSYDNEQANNGGEIQPGLYANDLSATSHMAI